MPVLSERYYIKLKYADSDMFLNMYEVTNFKSAHSIIEDGNISFGNTSTATITFDLYDAGPSIDNKLVSVWYGTKETKEEDYECLGIFKLHMTLWEIPKHSYEGYDAMVYALNELYDSKLEYPATVDAVANEISEQTGILYTQTKVFVSVIKAKPEGMTYRQALGYLAGLGGCNSKIVCRTYNDKKMAAFTFEWFSSYGTPDITDDMIYEDGGIELVNNSAAKIAYIKCYTAEDTLMTSGDITADYGITVYNPYMYQDKLDALLQEIVDANMEIIPITLKFIGDFAYTIGKIATVIHNGVTYNVPVMSVTQEFDGGLVTTISSYIQDEETESSGTTDPFPSSGGGGSGGGGTSTETAKYLNPPNSASYRTGEKGEFIHKRADTSDYFTVKSYSGKEVLKVYYESGEIESNGQKLDLTPITAANIDEWYGETVIPDAEGFKMISELEAPEYDLTPLDFELQVQTCEKVE